MRGGGWNGRSSLSCFTRSEGRVFSDAEGRPTVVVGPSRRLKMACCGYQHPHNAGLNNRNTSPSEQLAHLRSYLHLAIRTMVPQSQSSIRLRSRRPSIDVLHDAATYGASLLVNYSFDPAAKLGSLSLAGLSLPFRVEYITSTGTTADGAPNLLYAPGNATWSITVTPTHQYERFFTRAEFSYVAASHTTPGLAFGSSGSEVTQARLAFEAGFLFRGSWVRKWPKAADFALRHVGSYPECTGTREDQQRWRQQQWKAR